MLIYMYMDYVWVHCIWFMYGCIVYGLCMGALYMVYVWVHCIPKATSIGYIRRHTNYSDWTFHN